MSSYGISESEYNEMLKKQGGVCALCGAPPRSVSLHVDHCHVPGYRKLPPYEKRKYVRAILCFRCNKFRVGRLDFEWAKKIAAYLKKYEKYRRQIESGADRK